MRQSLLWCATVLLVAVAGCGPDPEDNGPQQTPSAAGTTDLTIVVDEGGGTQRTWRLTCDPTGGDHPRAEEACAALDSNGATALPPVPKDRQCAQVYGGPQTATVTGTWRGQQINSTLSRTNSCETARWDALDGLLPGSGS